MKGPQRLLLTSAYRPCLLRFQMVRLKSCKDSSAFNRHHNKSSLHAEGWPSFRFTTYMPIAEGVVVLGSLQQKQRHVGRLRRRASPFVLTAVATRDASVSLEIQTASSQFKEKLSIGLHRHGVDRLYRQCESSRQACC